MSILRCPRCRSQLALTDGRPFCTDIDCVYSKEGFPVAAGQMVLVDFANSVFVRDAYLDDRGSVLERDDTGRGFRRRLAASSPARIRSRKRIRGAFSASSNSGRRGRAF